MATVRCDRHGANHEAFVCTHLVAGRYLGFFCRLDEPANPFPDAWCTRCESIRMQFDGWNAESESMIDIALVCGGCYEEIRSRNLLGTESSSTTIH